MHHDLMMYASVLTVKFVKLDLLEENGYENRQTSTIKITVLQFMLEAP